MADIVAFTAAADGVFTAGAGTNDIFVAHGAGGTNNAWVVIDENDSGSFDAGDTFLIVTGYTGAGAATTLTTADFL